VSAESGKPTVLSLLERTVTVEAKASAAHHRVDKLESGISRDLTEIKAALTGISDEMKVVVAWMNRSKGWAAAGLLAAGVFGGIASHLILKALH
jgi:hypothetical protein